MKEFPRIEKLLLPVIFTIVLWLAIAAWFSPLQFRVFASDDLDTFSTMQASSAPPVRDFAVRYHKFRPVAVSMIFLIAKGAKCDFRTIASVGLAIHTVNAVIFFLLLYRTIKLPLSFSAGLTVLAIFNRFATYLLMQDEAILEGVGVALLLLLLIASLSFQQRPMIRYSLWLILLFALLVYGHERYLVLALPLILLSAANFRFNPKSSIVLSSGTTIVALSYLCLKKFWLRSPILVGTGGQMIDFNISQICSFVWRGTLNLIGINRGPAYLSLEDFPDSPFLIQLLSIAAAIVSCTLIAFVLSNTIALRAGKEKQAAFLRLSFYTVTIAVLLLSASITFRQEYRWLYPAFLVFLCLLADGFNLLKTRSVWFFSMLACLILLSLSREIYLARWHKRFWAFESYQIANNLFTTLHQIEELERQDSILIRGDMPNKEGVFLGGTFSSFYRLPPLEFRAKNSTIENTDTSRLVLDYDFSDRSFKIANDRPQANAQSHRMEYSVLEHSAAAQTPNDRWTTPTKTPLFPASKNGVNCMVVVAPIDIHFPAPGNANVLHACFSHMFAMGDGVDLEIAAIAPSGKTLLLSCVVPPLINNDFPVWRKYEFALPANTQQIELHVFSKTDPVADWIALRDFSFD